MNNHRREEFGQVNHTRVATRYLCLPRSPNAFVIDPNTHAISVEKK